MKPGIAILLLIFFSIGSVVSSGQCPSNKYQWDLSISYGINSPSQYSSSNELPANNTVTNGAGANFFTLRYFIYNRLALGATVGTASEKGTFSDATNPNSTTGTFQIRATAVALELYYIYFFRKYVEVYTFAGAGPAFTTTESIVGTTPIIGELTTTTKKDIMRGQYTPLGIRLGGRIGGYAEIGYGYKGIFNFGLSFKLGPSCWWRDRFR